MEIKTIAKKWGSSIGVIIPKEVVEERKIRENDEIIIEVTKAPLIVREIFGMLRGKIKKSGQEIKDEMRNGWESRADRKIWK